jgi:hypothetical protein
MIMDGVLQAIDYFALFCFHLKVDTIPVLTGHEEKNDGEQASSTG